MSDALAEILESISPEEILDAEGVAYRRTHGSRGPQLNVQECPRCGNTSWKVFLNEDSGLGNCFAGSCEARFNLFTFVRDLLGGVSNRDVFQYLKNAALAAGYRPKRESAKTVARSGDPELPESVRLPFNGQNLAYLQARGIDDEAAGYFDLRYCDSGAYRYMDGDKQRLQDFSKRVLFPVYDIDGTLKTFQGRDITDTAIRKYLFPPGLSASGTLLYNGHNAIGAKSAAIGEGVFDVMALRNALNSQPDLRDVAAIGTFGKHLGCGMSDDQLSRLLSLQAAGLESVTFCWDGEIKAVAAAYDAAKTLVGYGFGVRVARLPDEQDPSSMLPSDVAYAYRVATPYSSSAHLMAKLGRL